MTDPTLTAAQVKALRWLPEDGSWTIEKAPDRSTVRRRLTPAGIAARREVG